MCSVSTSGKFFAGAGSVLHRAPGIEIFPPSSFIRSSVTRRSRAPVSLPDQLLRLCHLRVGPKIEMSSESTSRSIILSNLNRLRQLPGLSVDHLVGSDAGSTRDGGVSGYFDFFSVFANFEGNALPPFILIPATFG